MTARPSDLLLATDACVAALDPLLNCVPRISALELFEAPLGGRYISLSHGVHCLFRESAGDACFAFHFSASQPLTGALPIDELLSACADRDASSRLVFGAVPHPLVPRVTRGLAAAGRGVTFTEPCRTWVPRKGSALDGGTASRIRALAAAALPPEFSFGALRADDVEFVNAVWKYKTATSAAMVAEAIATRPSACIRASDGTLAAWTVLRADASWGLLGVPPAQRRRGLARAVMMYAFAEQAAWVAALSDAAEASGDRRRAQCARLLSPYVHIANGNAESEGLFRALDFEPVADVTWVVSTADAVAVPATPQTPLPLTRLDPSGLSSSWADLLSLINKSYREDDEFFVDQERTNAETLAEMAREGDFFVASVGGDGSVIDVSVYVKIAHGAAENVAPFSADSRGRLSDGTPQAARAPGAPSCEAPFGSRVAPRDSTTASISMLTIASALKRRGMAQRVLEWVESHARAQGVQTLEAFVVSVKPWLLNFYEKNGFERVGAEDWPRFLEWQLKIDCHFVQMRKRL